MSLILLLYVLPLILGVLVVYIYLKKDEGIVSDLLTPLAYMLIPLINILMLVVFLSLLTKGYIENNQSIQNFLNKRL